MKGTAYVLHEYNEPLRPEQRDYRAPADDEVLVRVGAAGICATDVKAAAGRLPEIERGRVLGHEIAGEVAHIGSSVRGHRVGDHVCLYFRDPCDSCAYCRSGREHICSHPGPRPGFERDGGFAEYVAVRGRNLFAIGDLRMEHAAILPDAVATAVHAVVDRGAVGPDDSVLVLGAGGLGLHAAQIARSRGASVTVADPSDERRAGAAALGLGTEPLGRDADAAGDVVLGSGANVVVDCYGTAAMTEVIRALPMDARLVCVGYFPDHVAELAQQHAVRREVTIVGARGATRANLGHAIELVGTGQVVPCVGDVLPMSRIDEAMSATASYAGRGRMVVVPGH